jgi:hypothetical protein
MALYVNFFLIFFFEFMIEWCISIIFPAKWVKWPQKQYADATMHRHFGTISK